MHPPAEPGLGQRRLLRGREAGALVAYVLVLLTVSPVRAQVSPGPLSRAHASLEGSTKCFRCHRTGEGGLDRECIACHDEIAWSIARSRGLHGREAKDNCAKCHPEHAGPDFSLTNWPDGGPRDFDHAKTGWGLQGKHAQVKCRECHTPKYQVSPAMKKAERKDPSRSWIGLEQACASCHEDIHKGALGADCAGCHSAATWKEATRFDHGKTAYPLLGAHVKVACDKCHLSPKLSLPLDASGRAKPLYKPLPHAECTACHDDPHGGRLGAACSKCHTVEEWRRLPQGAFDHDKTRYPLKGLHRTVACEKCHGPKTARVDRPKDVTCGTCHRDAHAGLATLAGKPADCEACHDERAYRPSTYTVERHQTSSYPLTGLHAKAACEKCHRKDTSQAGLAAFGTSGVSMRPRHALCTDCHADAHAGQLASRPDRGACDACHGTEGWKPTRFAVREHAATRLPLEGRHAEIPCGACHAPDRKDLPPLLAVGTAGVRGVGGADLSAGSAGAGPGGAGSNRAGGAGQIARTVLRGVETECKACHGNPHGEVFPRNDTKGGARACGECHDMTVFSPSRVDARMHQRYAYALEGAHGAVPCQACHKELDAPRGKSSLVLAPGPARRLEFRDARRLCAECHADPHGGQFASRPGAGACDGCHDLSGFKPATRFNHANSRFVLDGAHARVPCAKCHPSKTDSSGRSYVVYRPLPYRCEDCHGAKIPGGSSGVGAGGIGTAGQLSSLDSKGGRS